MTKPGEWISQKKWKKLRKDQWLILFLAGVLLLIIAMPSGCQEARNTGADEMENTQDNTASETSDYGQELERRLEETLSGISGVGRVKVMITFHDSGEAVVEKDVAYSSQEQTEQGTDHTQTSVKQTQSTEETVFAADSSDGQPYVRMQKTPVVKGVLVVAECGEHSEAASDISEAIQALFGLEAHKIKIVKMNTAQEGTDEHEENIP